MTLAFVTVTGVCISVSFFTGRCHCVTGWCHCVIGRSHCVTGVCISVSFSLAGVTVSLAGVTVSLVCASVCHFHWQVSLCHWRVSLCHWRVLFPKAINEHLETAVGREGEFGERSVGHGTASLALVQPHTDGCSLVAVAVCRTQTAPSKTCSDFG